SVRVEFLPQAAGDYVGKVAFYMSDPKLQTAWVDLHGVGDDGCFFLTPGALDFGGTQVGCSLPEHFAYATNQCSQPVTVTAADVTPGPFVISTMPPLPFSVATNTQATNATNYTTTPSGDASTSLNT